MGIILLIELNESEYIRSSEHASEGKEALAQMSGTADTSAVVAAEAGPWRSVCPGRRGRYHHRHR